MGTSIQSMGQAMGQAMGRREVAGWQPLLEAKQGVRSQNLGPLARALSLVVGGTALIAGLRFRGPLRWALLAAGAFGWRRGVTGHCSIYQMLGASSHESAPHASVHESVTIACPREEVERRWHEQAPGLLGPLYGTEVQAHFASAPGERGTEVTLVATLPARAGVLDLLLDKVSGRAPQGRLRDVLRRFKARLEAGEVPALGPPVPTGPMSKITGRFLA
jgi:uncharacterized membrane protein